MGSKLFASPRLAACAALGVLLAACSGNQDPRQPASVVIGPNGATFTVTSGPLTGTSITVPRGALSEPTTITIDETQTSDVPDAIAAGPGAVFGPFGTTFAVDATLTLIFDAASLPPGVTSSDFVVKARTSQGRIVDIAPDAVNMAMGTVTAKTDRVGSFWVAVSLRNGNLDLFAYLPLGVDDIYSYENGITASVGISQSEPNVATPVVVLAFAGNVVNERLYLDRFLGDTMLLGRHNLVLGTQTVLDFGLTLLPAAGGLGSVTQSVDFFTGYDPYGAVLPSIFGIETMKVTVVSQGRLDTPLGRFNDVVEVVIESSVSSTLVASATLRDRLWLARGVGPVQIDLEGAGGRAGIVSATVNGLTVEVQ